jgi:hypothetical protein
MHGAKKTAVDETHFCFCHLMATLSAASQRLFTARSQIVGCKHSTNLCTVVETVKV